jgi:hypothetical protein
MAGVRSPRRAAGVRFEVLPPPIAQVLPRMDIALFVGFSASGPLSVPVAVDDPSQFESVFGTDAPLAWDPSQGALMNAYLAPAVRSYFLNGGRRCWVIRVAGAGATNEFPVPGMVCRLADGTLQPATATARSQGSWSDTQRVASVLLSRPLAPGASVTSAAIASLDVVTSAIDDVIVGDLMRLTFYVGPTESRVAMFVVSGIDSLVPTSAAPATMRLYPVRRADGTPDVTWFCTSSASVPVGSTGTMGSPGPSATLQGASGGTFELLVAVSFAAAPTPGTTLAIDFSGAQLWLTVSTVVSAGNNGSPPLLASPPVGVLITGQGLFVDRAPAAPPTSPELTGFEVERLKLQLQTQQGTATPASLGGLGFDPSHPTAFWALPSDLELYRGTDDTTDTDARSVALRNLATQLAPLWNLAAEPRFPLAATGNPDITFFPIGMPYTPQFFVPCAPPSGTSLERDGLSSFDASLFLDPALAGVGAAELLSEANFIQYQSSVPRRLQGIYAAIGVTEATIIAVPDAALPGWTEDEPPSIPPGTLAQPVVPGNDGSFYSCAQRSLALPELVLAEPPDDTGSFLLAWQAVAGASQYTIEESPDPQFQRSVVTYTTSQTQLFVYGHTPGVFYLRASAISGALTSGWSAGLAVVVLPGQGWVALDGAANPAPALASVQSALLTLCAARGDLFALLSLPAYQQAADAAAYVSTLCVSQDPSTLGFGAIYHPWLISRDGSTGPLRTIPPDGAIAGVYARRTLARGAWIAPANEPLAPNVLGLSPLQSDAVWAVLDEQPVNRVRAEARGLMAMSADTLTADPDLVPVNVRRLLILLRRVALSIGNAFVFEPNGPKLARMVQRRFTSLLDGLYQQGAFAGASASQAYRVVTDASVNPPASVDLGRFVVELQVAPSWPLSFLTVRLVQTGNQVLVAQSG